MKKALIAMSGGVDSSVAAYLMQRAGYTCQGVTMRLYRNSDLGMACHKTCCAETDAEDAALVCFRLGIAFEELDYSALFRYRVIERFAAAYEAGLTPNPCVDCNRFMKFDTLLEHALSEGCDKLATGHYARVGYCAESGRWELRKAVDGSKDQSYVLYMLTQRQLAHLALPLGGSRVSKASSPQRSARARTSVLCRTATTPPFSSAGGASPFRTARCWTTQDARSDATAAQSALRSDSGAGSDSLRACGSMSWKRI